MGRLVQWAADKTARGYCPWRFSFYKSCSDCVMFHVLCSSAPWYGDLRRYHFTSLQNVVSQWPPRMAKAQRRCQGNCDGTTIGNCLLAGYHCATAHLHTIARLECGGDVAGLPTESATTDRAALAVCACR